MSIEEWRPVLGYEGLYEASSEGRVKSLPRKVTRSDGLVLPISGRILAQKYQHNYWRTTICKGGVCECRTVHSLVCEAFHGPRPEGAVIRHLNGNHVDNRPENLAWGTPAENSADMVRHGNSHWANQTHCIHGHEFTPENTRSVVRGGRVVQRNCRECERLRSVGKQRRKRARVVRERMIRICEVCGGSYPSNYQQARFCSSECKAASRRVDFKRREFKGAA